MLKEALTVENEQYNPCPFLMQSTITIQGEGKAIVCVVGERTRVGRSQRLLDIEDEQTPLQQKLKKIADLIGVIGLTCAILTLIALLI